MNIDEASLRVSLAPRIVRILLDIALLTGAFLSAWLLRFEGDLPGERLRQAVILLPYVVALKYALLAASGVERQSWRYVNLPDVVRLVASLAVASICMLGVRLFAPLVFGFNRAEELGLVIPLGVIGIDATVSVLALTTGRVLRRFQVQERERATRARSAAGSPAKRALLVGAGRAGVRIAEEMRAHPEAGYIPVGFVDDDRRKKRQVIGGVTVVGDMAGLSEVMTQFSIDEVIITDSTTPAEDVRRVTDTCAQAGLPVKIVPELMDLVGQHVNLSRIRPVAINDLLRRSPVELDLTAIRSYVEGEVVLVTGAGGSIGSELCRQLLRFGPERLLLVDRAEPALWSIHHELMSLNPPPPVEAHLVDVVDSKAIDGLLIEHEPATVFHAAAHKHVPIMESHPGESVRNNVLGTKVVADLAARRGVSRFVLISTDKAVNPSSVMGATKRVAERYVQQVARETGRPFVSVRFGNVLGSTGSVVKVFQRQIREGGPITVTHPEMRRYFMTVSEATQLVLQAGSMGLGGEIFILDMGEPVLIADLAQDLVRLSGLSLGRDIDIEYTGVRPGEKLFEELSLADEVVDRTTHTKIFIMRGPNSPWSSADDELAALLDTAVHGRPPDIRDALLKLVPEFEPNPTGEFLLTDPAERRGDRRRGSAHGSGG